MIWVEYRVPDLPPGRYLVHATAWDTAPVPTAAESEGNGTPTAETVYAPTYYPGTVDRKQAAAIEVHAGDEVPAAFALVTSQAFHVRGIVRDLPAAWGTGTAIELRSKTDGNDTSSTGNAIGKDGKFDIPKVFPGSYRVWLLFNQGSDGHWQEVSTGQAVEVTNTEINGIRVMPAPTSQVHGQIRMDTGQRLDWSQMSVELTPDEDSEVVGPTQVKGDGSFEIKNVSSDVYRLSVQLGRRTFQDDFVKSVNLGEKDVSEAGFTTGGGTYSLDVVISAKGATVEGTVLDGKDKPVVDARVVVIPETDRRRRRDLYQDAGTDQQGRFILRGLDPGDYTLLAFEDLEDDPRDPDFIKAYENRGQSVSVKEGERKSIVLKIISAPDEQPRP
jgi:hypothetical protein